MNNAKTAAKRDIAGTSFCPPSEGRICTVRGYYTGDFIGRVESVDRCTVLLTVLDPLREYPDLRTSRCPYPQCIGEDEHEGGHLFPKICAGQRVEVSWKLARFELHPAGSRANVIEFPISRGAA